MNLEYVPLLHQARQLYDLPRGRNRFHEYLRTMRDGDGSGLELPPLVIMNPMAREHVPAMIDRIIAMDADGIAARAVVQAARDLVETPGDFKIALVVADDLMGGWTNRYASEFDMRFPHIAISPEGLQPPHWSHDLWLGAVLWSSESVSERSVHETVLAAIYRAAYLARHGHARTLRDMLAQEGWVMAESGFSEPQLAEEDLAYTRDVISAFLEVGDMRTAIECIFGDAAARSLGFTPRGLSPRAGLALALHDAVKPRSLSDQGDDAS